jgi:hypothetical protein
MGAHGVAAGWLKWIWGGAHMWPGRTLLMAIDNSWQTISQSERVLVIKELCGKVY